MKMTWLGQAGLLLKIEGLTILADPYLSDSVKKINPQNARRIPVDKTFFNVCPDLLLLTHNHLDHTDPETLTHFLSQGQVTVLASQNAWEEARKFGGNHNYVLLNRHSQWSQGKVTITAVKAAHSDPYAVGFLIQGENKTLYLTGDTLYHTEIFNDLPEEIDWIFLPINGVGNNMNLQDAARFAAQCGAKGAVPLHFGMFDSIDPAQFAFQHKLIPIIYKELIL